MQAQGEHTTYTQKGPSGGLNQERSRCDVTMLITGDEDEEHDGNNGSDLLR